MMNLDLLLNPIDANSPSGVSLRYDPVYDQVADARAEDDATLPSGLWVRQPKRADLVLVISLTHEALARRSKDLWLAAWLGHAEMKSRGVGALPEVLLLLEELQVRFWNTLHPEIEEGDLGARSAPLQWALEQYAALLVELPSLTPTVSYQDYKAARLDGKGSTEDLDVALEAVATPFFVERLAVLTEIGRMLEQLSVFCEKRYGEDGPSFSKIRRAADEVRNTAATLLRVRREQELELGEVTPTVKVASPGSHAEGRWIAESEKSHEAAEKFPFAIEELDKDDDGSFENSPKGELEPVGAGSKEILQDSAGKKSKLETPPLALEPRSREEALRQIEVAGRFLARSIPSDPIGYTVLSARLWAQVRNTKGDGGSAPTSDLRLELRTLRQNEQWAELLDTAIGGLTSGRGERWLDLHRDVWMAATQLGAEKVAASAVQVAQLMVEAGAEPKSRFEDETPLASYSTQQWIKNQCSKSNGVYTESEKSAEMAAQTSEEWKDIESPEGPLEKSEERPDADVLATAMALATDGDLEGGLTLLMADAATSATRRKRFFRRLEAAQLCVQAGRHEVAGYLLERLLAEVSECGVEVWEGTQVMARVLSLLLQCSVADGRESDDSEKRRTEMMAWLCAVDPVRALQLQAGR